jgi:serine/threonine protein kinase
MEYGKSVDWWMLGCVIFEMLTGTPPFYSPDKAEMYEAVKFGTAKYSPNWDPNTRNILELLLKKNPLVRLGTSSRVRDHPWFEDVNWDALLKMQYEAPFVPKLTSPTDVQHFSQEFTEMSLNSLNVSSSSPSKYLHFEGFTYDCDWNNSLPLKHKPEMEALIVTKASELDDEFSV